MKRVFRAQWGYCRETPEKLPEKLARVVQATHFTRTVSQITELFSSIMIIMIRDDEA